jgi:hypothetical protein
MSSGGAQQLVRGKPGRTKPSRGLLLPPKPLGTYFYLFSLASFAPLRERGFAFLSVLSNQKKPWQSSFDFPAEMSYCSGAELPEAVNALRHHLSMVSTEEVLDRSE